MRVRLLLFLLAMLPLRASTVLLSITGRVSGTDAGSYFPSPPVGVADLWTVTMRYQYPAVGSEFIGVRTYGDSSGSLLFTVNGLAWESHFVGGFVGGISFRAGLGSGTSAPPGLTGGAGTSSVSLEWSGPESMIPDPSSLPESFAQWNLPSAASFSLEVSTDLSAPGSAWHIRANSWDTMTIQVIPEPSAAGLVAIAVLGRRRRGRA